MRPIGLSIGWNTSVLRSMLIVVIVFSLGCLRVILAAQLTLNVLILIPANTSDAIANRTSGAIVVALDTIKKRDTLHDIELDWSLTDSQCSSIRLAMEAYKEWMKRRKPPDVIIGGYCDQVCNLLTTITSALNVPFIAIGCKPNDARNHNRMPTFLTMDYYRPSYLPILVKLMETYNWKRLAILTTSDRTYLELGLKAKVMVEAKEWTAVFILTTINMATKGYKSLEVDENINLVLEEIRRNARIVLLAMSKFHAARILLLAKKAGMYNGEYAFIGYQLNGVDALSIGATEDEWRSAKVGIITTSPGNFYAELEGSHFVTLINNALTRNYDQFSQLQRRPLENDDMYLVHAGDLYVALRLYAILVNSTLTRMGNVPSDQWEAIVRNGTLLLSTIPEAFSASAQQTNIDDSLGYLRFSKIGMRIPAMGHLINVKEFNETVMYEFKQGVETVTVQKQTLTWPGGGTEVPLDEPKCGWEDEKCMKTRDLILICVCGVLGSLVLVGVIVSIFISRRMKKKLERKTLADWQVKWSQVIVLGDNVIGRFSGHDMSRSKSSFEATSHVDQSETRSGHKSLTGHLYTLAGKYKGKIVAIKKINRDTVDFFNPVIFNEIKQLFYISHENVNPFIGICSEAPNVSVLMLYADRGSLQDVLAEPKYDINWEFRICLATDIAKGMEYLHESPVGPHGHLTSSNCVVDRKWECRITDYGLKQFKRTKNQEITTFRWNSDLLWTAPEILQQPDTDRARIYGTKEGDVYSFGIIVSEIITKEMPYHSELESITPEDVIMKLKRDPQFRPALPKPEGPIGAGWNNLVSICWHRKPEVRPSFKMIRGKLRSINGGKIPNLMERMQRMMEDALHRKETAISAERKRTETVVYNLLPQSVADSIVGGKEIRPQRFEAVTLCYCETSDVLPTIKSLSPIQVAVILKSLFGLYDDIMKRYSVTEISGRGSKDSMIVASGIPQFTEGHAEEICELSLDLISEALTFKTPLAPLLSPNIKISIHSGPVLTAVIWRTLPKYCVSGEAVDTVKAMQIASKAMRARISEATYNQLKKSGGFTFQEGGKVAVKNAKAMRTYWLTGKTGYPKPLPSSTKHRSSSLAEEKEGLKEN